VDLVLLVKPQFEVGKARVGKGGVVRDPDAHADAISGVIAAAARLGLTAAGLVASPITGPAGNHEYLLWLRGEGPSGVKPSDVDPSDGAPCAVDAEAIKKLVTRTLAPS
jgi:23S rRNA (cytidine1920-2'-O)/16S rRNA (cytidine1409-2'-O)-methyltransferase